MQLLPSDSLSLKRGDFHWEVPNVGHRLVSQSDEGNAISSHRPTLKKRVGEHRTHDG